MCVYIDMYVCVCLCLSVCVKVKECMYVRTHTQPWMVICDEYVCSICVRTCRKRFFFSDEMVDGCETAEMGLVYVQSRNGILNGTYPVSKEEAIQFAALQCQVEMGDYSAREHQQGCLR